MLILIAESKSMSDKSAVGRTETGTPPLFQSDANEIMEGLRSMDVGTLASELKLGPKNAMRLFQEVYDFNSIARGCRAIEAFTGIVFKALDAATLSDDARERMTTDVRIVSSLYGLLRPEDIIKPYRLDFTMRAAPGNRSLTDYWKSKVTIALVKYMRENGITEILNILPLDASKCFDWKLIKNFADVYIANIKEYKEEGKLSTPRAERLKFLRGTLLRHILAEDITTCRDLRSLSTPELEYESDSPFANHLLFVSA